MKCDKCGQKILDMNTPETLLIHIQKRRGEYKNVYDRSLLNSSNTPQSKKYKERVKRNCEKWDAWSKWLEKQIKKEK